MQRGHSVERELVRNSYFSVKGSPIPPPPPPTHAPTHTHTTHTTHMRQAMRYLCRYGGSSAQTTCSIAATVEALAPLPAFLSTLVKVGRTFKR